VLTRSIAVGIGQVSLSHVHVPNNLKLPPEWWWGLVPPGYSGTAIAIRKKWSR